MNFQMTESGFTTTFEHGNIHISGDETQGFRPYQLLVSSIAVCSGGVLRKVLEKRRMVVDDIQLSAEVQRNEEEANRVEAIHLHFRMKGVDLDEEKIRKSLDITFKNCSMAQSVKDSIRLTDSFEIVS
ncbi:OsmC family protein [Aureibacillus halotolerans]|uniref:Putative OsmC-like protein n=1 Tax=Aureibacillus halotolerans TaxID=1508390 RepID=A0A4R6TWK5_9BACI|nr:OsmC family protein [Aureibacillus halotolerans]TDQ36399.1 putative OsmC-like protein [Aureibacillus halotolerans]